MHFKGCDLMKQKTGRQPKTGTLKHVGVYLPQPVYESLKERAEKERRSISSTISIILEDNLGMK
jgi:hypothetical protein